MDKQPLISVIVPSYNVEKVYRECVDSILSQTYDNLEVILVNDGSTDSTGEIADEYAKLDSRVRVIHKENGGAASARNRGLDIAVGDYYGFIDSDDWIEANMYERLIEPFLSGELSSLSFSEIAFRNHNLDGSTEEECLVDEAKLICGDNLWDDFFDITESGLIRQSMCNKLFSATLMSDCRFQEGVIGEDIEILYKILDRAESCMVLPYVAYHARRVATSVTHKPLTEINFSIADIVNEKLDFIKEYHPNKIIEAHVYDLKQQTNIWQRMVYAQNSREFKGKRKIIKKRIARDLKVTRNSELVSKKERAIGYLVLLNLFKIARTIMVHK